MPTCSHRGLSPLSHTLLLEAGPPHAVLAAEQGWVPKEGCVSPATKLFLTGACPQTEMAAATKLPNDMGTIP